MNFPQPNQIVVNDIATPAVFIADAVTGAPFGTAANPINVTGGGGGGGGVEDLLFTDDTGAQFIYRDSGATPPVFTAYLIPAGTAYTPSTNPRPYYVKSTAVSNLPTTVDTNSGNAGASTLRSALDGTKITAAALGSGGVGAIGWLSQIANFLSNLPASLGQKTAALSFPVTIASDNAIIGTFFTDNKTVTGANTSTALPSHALLNGVLVAAPWENTGNLRVALGTASATVGVELPPGSSAVFPVASNFTNTSSLQIFSSGASDSVAIAGS